MNLRRPTPEPPPPPPEVPAAAGDGGVDPMERGSLDRDLAGHATRSGAFMVTSHGIQFLVGIASAMIVARLLTPADFGLVAMAGVLTGFAVFIKDFGLATATVQKATLDQGELSRLFWLNLKLNVLLTLFLVAMAPVLAWFFGEPSLLAIIPVLSAGIFVSILSNLHVGLLRRQMRFGIVSLIEIGSLVAGITAGVVIAIVTRSFWALVFQELILWVTQGAGFLLACRWIPSRNPPPCTKSDSGFRALRTFGREVTLAKLLAYLSENLSRILIGRFAGAADVGFYNSAYRWSVLAPRQMHIPLLGVIVATLSRLQDDPGRYRIFFRNIAAAIYFFSFPALAFLFVDGYAVIVALLGDQWIPAVPLFQILVVSSLGYTATRVTKWIYLSEGRTGTQLRWNLIAAPVTITGIALGLPWGATGIAIGYTAAASVLIFPSLWFCLRGSTLCLRDILAPALMPFGAAILSGLILVVLRPQLLPDGLLFFQLAVHAAVFGAFYFVLWLTNPMGLQHTGSVIRFLLNRPEKNQEE